MPERGRPVGGGFPSTVSVVIPGELVIGPSPDAALLQTLIERGVTAVLSLQQPAEAGAPPARLRSALAWQRRPLGDGELGEVARAADVVLAVRQLDAWRRAGHLSYLHCRLGVGRAPLVAAAYLMVVKGESLGAAIEQVRQARPRASFGARQLLALSSLTLLRLDELPADTSCQ